jgi:Transposase domain (DUF772)
MVVLAMLLEYHDDCSDAQAEARMRFDLRWKHALGLGLEEAGFDSSVLCRFRRKLLERGLERELFERLVNAAREAGLIAKDARQLSDSTHTYWVLREPETPTHSSPGWYSQAAALARILPGEQSRAFRSALVVHRPLLAREARDRLG